MGRRKWGHPAVPRSRRCMMLCKYDLFPYMTVHFAHMLPDGSYRWVSSFNEGHQKLGVWTTECRSGLAVLTVEEGIALEKELDVLRGSLSTAKDALYGGFMAQRDAVLKKHGIRIPKDQ